jgi:hypothetical protein
LIWPTSCYQKQSSEKAPFSQNQSTQGEGTLRWLLLKRRFLLLEQLYELTCHARLESQRPKLCQKCEIDRLGRRHGGFDQTRQYLLV